MTQILNKLIPDILKKSFLDYSMSVITDRALPDVRDGLKPVHRRILWAMYESGNVAGKPYRKSARTVGDVIGKYHPHGDAAVYGAMVRMAQPFSLMSPLIDGQGNFGSIDDDPPAAMRYTEARLSKIATDAFFADVKQETVPFRPNYDGSEEEPVVLPAAVPNLLVNGVEGIAVGMACSIPTHNLGEVAEAAKLLMRNPTATVAEIMKVLPAPDFPTGGTLFDTAGFADALLTGRGRVRLRAKWHVEKRQRGEAIVIDEIPYATCKADLIAKIADLVKAKTIEDITDLRDESSKEGVRIWIAVRQGADPHYIAAQLFAHTDLEKTVSYNVTVLDGGVKPREMGLKDCLLRWIDFRRDVVKKRHEFERKQALKRLHILQGFMKAMQALDEVIQTIRDSANRAIARDALMALLVIDEEQAEAILDLRLHKLTSMELDALREEHEETQARVQALTAIIESPERIDAIIVEELDQAAQRFGESRKTEIDESLSSVRREDLIADEDVVLVMTRRGYTKRISAEDLKRQNRGTRGKRAIDLDEGDEIVLMESAHSKDMLFVFTASGRVHGVHAYDVPEASGKGRHIKNVIEGLDEEIVAACVVPENVEGLSLAFATRAGIVKRTEAAEYSGAWRKGGVAAITLDEGDAIVAVGLVRAGSDIMLVAADGSVIRFPAEDVRCVGRIGRGVIGMRAESPIVDMIVLSPDEPRELLLVTQQAFAKKCSLALFRGQGRGGKGVTGIKVSDKSGPVVAARLIAEDEDVVVMTDRGVSNRISGSEIRELGRAAVGTRLVKLDDGASVAFVSLAKEEAEQQEMVAA
jgi:DNA gyrase subunit A